MAEKKFYPKETEVSDILSGKTNVIRFLVSNLVYDPDHDLPCYVTEDQFLAFPERFYDGMIKAPFSIGDKLLVMEEFQLGLCPNNPHGLVSFRHGKPSSIPHPDADPKCVGWCHMWRNMKAKDLPRWAVRYILDVTFVDVEYIDDAWVWKVTFSKAE